MLSARHAALLGTSALVGFSLARPFSAHAASQSNRVYTSIRQEWEFNQLLSLPNPLLANFCILTEPKSQTVSDVLQRVVSGGDTPMSVSSVDVEMDEPGVRDLIQRYLVSDLPTIVALQGGEQVGRLIPQSSDADHLETEIRDWIKELASKV